MSDRAPAMDPETVKFGLLMESAQAHQKLAETHLEKLRAHTQDLDGVVRDEIRRTLVEELRMLTTESRRATEVLRNMKRASASRGAIWSIATAILCTAIPIAVMRLVVPSEAEIAALRARRDQLAASVASLEQHGGRIELKHCGEAARLCVRVDRKAPTYGEKADFYVVAGY
jgi:hypothetical protein